MHNKKFLIGALAAIAIAITGIVYSGVGTSQPASIGNLLALTTAPKVVKPVYDNGVYVGADKVANPQTSGNTTAKVDSQPKVKYPTSGEPKTGLVEDRTLEVPTSTYPGLEKETKAFQDSITALEKKIQGTVSPTDGKRKLIILGNGWCANTGPFGGTAHIFYCGL